MATLCGFESRLPHQQLTDILAVCKLSSCQACCQDIARSWATRPCCAGSGPGAPTSIPKIVRAYVKRLRDKLADEADRPALIVNERGVGYRMPRPGDP